jgi:hypothetical protein
MITEEREMIVQAVLAGALAADYLTAAEVEGLELLVFDAAMERQLEQAMTAGNWQKIGGKAVFCSTSIYSYLPSFHLLYARLCSSIL